MQNLAANQPGQGLYSDVQKTQVKRDSLNPEWNESLSFRNIDDEDLQEKYFEITVMNKDLITKDKIIGTVNIDLGHLLTGHET